MSAAFLDERRRAHRPDHRGPAGRSRGGARARARRARASTRRCRRRGHAPAACRVELPRWLHDVAERLPESRCSRRTGTRSPRLRPCIAEAAAELVARVRSGMRSTATRSALSSRISRERAISGRRWSSPIATRRRYRLLFEDARLDVWVLSWMPGQATGYHDHARLQRRAHGAPGVVLERQIRVGRESIERVLAPGPASSWAPPATSIPSPTAAGAPAVTLHAYSPPLIEVGQYRAGPGGELAARAAARPAGAARPHDRGLIARRVLINKDITG